MTEDHRKIVLYLAGGTMSGVFGAGVVCALEKRNFYPKIQAVFAGSAGAMNAAYFLAGQARFGVPVYTKYMLKHFIYPGKIPLGILKLAWRRYVKPNSKQPVAVDIDYIMQVVAHKVPLNSQAVMARKIPFFVKVLNIKTLRVEYLKPNAKNLLTILKAAISIVPYYPFAHKVGRRQYIDGTIQNPIGIQEIVKRFPRQKIVVVMNETGQRGFRHYLKNFVEGSVSKIFLKELFQIYLAREELLREDLRFIRKHPKILIIHPHKLNPTRPRTTNLKKLLTTLDMGRQSAKKIINFANQ